MDMQTLRAQAKEGMKGFCNLCPVCDGRACAGKIPGMGGTLTGSSFMENHRALQAVKLNMRTIHDAWEPDTSFSFAGAALETPIMNGPMASPNNNCGPIDDYTFVESVVLGTHQAGSLGFIGDPCAAVPFTNGCEALRKAGRGVVIAKPHEKLDAIFARFEQAREAGATGFGMDIDGAGILLLRSLGFRVGPKTKAELKELCAYTPDRSFIVKGVMTVDEAVCCVEAGAGCIVVSNHGGRVLDGLPGVAEVLPAIAREVGKDITILADGSVRSGVDALKLLALGAKGVLVGRPLCWGAYGGGAAGVKLIMDTYTAQLRQAMILTGCRSLSDIGPHLIYGAK
ncbi:alpha-hydroxy-acid oxidizing protein [Christensenellaceae bacterium OttesenSCG-928-L17]|nr:alpha-hydroxy-acid oxidizing protein [Christensenellaceae bacterium OttesenSCG-928-L17]